MASSSVCDCSPQGLFGEQFKHFILRTSKHAAVAIGLNVLCMYLLGEEDCFPGVINGGATALSFNMTNKVVHCVWPQDTPPSKGSKKTSKQTLYETARLALVILASYIMIPQAYEFFDYHPKMRNVLEQTTFSCIGILGTQKYLKAKYRN